MRIRISHSPWIFACIFLLSLVTLSTNGALEGFSSIKSTLILVGASVMISTMFTAIFMALWSIIYKKPLN